MWSWFWLCALVLWRTMQDLSWTSIMVLETDCDVSSAWTGWCHRRQTDQPKTWQVFQESGNNKLKFLVLSAAIRECRCGKTSTQTMLSICPLIEARCTLLQGCSYYWYISVNKQSYDQAIEFYNWQFERECWNILLPVVQVVPSKSSCAIQGRDMKHAY